VDWDADGKLDLVAGDERGEVWFYRNTGTAAEPELAAGVQVEANGKPICGTRRIYERVDGEYKVKETIAGSSELADKYSKIHAADWNGDGKLDLLIGHSRGEFLLYVNSGEKGAPAFGDPAVIKPESGNFPVRPSPFLVDWNGDGVRDLLVGSEGGTVVFHPNIGSEKEPRYGPGETLMAGGNVLKKGNRARFDVADWNNDGKLDLLVGDYYSIKDETAPNGRRSGGNVWLYVRR
jgi:hypothetical protein